MNETKKLTLIEGVFSIDDSKEILTNIFSSKINYHNMRNWSSKERLGKDDEIAQNRLSSLKGEVEILTQILSVAREKNMKLLVRSEICITLQSE